MDATVRCRSCEEELPLERFGSNSGMATGRLKDCKACTNAKARARYKANPEPARRKALARYYTLGDQGPAAYRAYYAKNRHKMRERHAANKHRRRALILRSNCGCVTTAALKELALALGARCVYCEGPFEHWDHATPLARGGLNCIENLVTACADCNRRKNAKTQEEFLALTAACSPHKQP